MKKFGTRVVLFALCATLMGVAAAQASNVVRISQQYGGGGAASGAPTYNVDYVELFNNSGAAVNIGGWAIEYASSTGAWASSATNAFVFPANTLIQPCKYILVQFGVPSAAGGPLPVPADFSGNLSMSATAGKVALLTQLNSNVACGSEVGLVDKVAYGSNTCAEGGTGAGGTSNQQGVVRNNGGVSDSDVNGTDFTVVTNPTPRNSASPANATCVATDTKSKTWGMLKVLYR